MTAADPSLGRLIALARGYADDAPCDGALLAALADSIRTRSVSSDPPPPQVTGLRIRREGLPDWWRRGDNLILAAPGSAVSLGNGFGVNPANGNVGVVGNASPSCNLTFPDSGGLIVVGDRTQLTSVSLAASSNGTILIGEDTTAGFYGRVDARNGGAVIVGADGMWSTEVNIVTDDMHAIRDMETGRRVNSFGSRIVIERHVWLGAHCRIMGGTRIGTDTVVGLASVAGKTTLPPNSICVGAPCKPIRTGSTWTREDLP